MLIALITLLIASFALSVSGTTLYPVVNSTSLTSLGDRPSRHEGPTNCLYTNWMDPPDSCMCFDDSEDTYGIDRAYMIDAINQACNEFTGGVGEPVAVYGRADGLVGGE